MGIKAITAKVRLFPLTILAGAIASFLIAPQPADGRGIENLLLMQPAYTPSNMPLPPGGSQLNENSPPGTGGAGGDGGGGGQGGYGGNGSQGGAAGGAANASPGNQTGGGSDLTSPPPASSVHGGGTENSSADAFANSLPSKSGGQCAQYGRQLVGKITGDSYFNQGVGNGGAASAGSYLTDSGHFTPSADNGVYNNGDTRLYQGGRQGYGHWETYYKGNWYSDFQQQGPLTSNVGKNYSSAQLYRLNQ